MQIDTLKSTLTQKELEITKLKQSDSLKTKQINNKSEPWTLRDLEVVLKFLKKNKSRDSLSK